MATLETILNKHLRIGKVLQIESDKIKLNLSPKNVPQECLAKGCGACKISSPQVEIYYPKSCFAEEVSEGDTVRVEVALLNDGLSAALLFLIPILFATLAYFGATSFGASAESLHAIIFTVLAGILGFLPAIIVDKVFSKFNPPQIFREIIEDSGKNPECKEEI